MKCLLLSLQQLLWLFGALRCKFTVFYSEMATAMRGWTKLLELYGTDCNKEAIALFSVCFLSPLPLSRMSSISWTQLFFFFNCLVSCRCYFKVVSLPLTVCVWLVDSKCWLFSKPWTQPLVVRLERGRRKCYFHGTGEGGGGNHLALSPLYCCWKCVCTCVSVSLCH